MGKRITRKQFQEDILHVSPATFYRMMVRDELPDCIRIGNHLIWDEDDIVRFLAERKGSAKDLRKRKEGFDSPQVLNSKANPPPC